MSKVYTPTPRVPSHFHSFRTNSPNKKTLKLKARNSIQNSRRQCLGTRVPKPAAAIESCTKRSWIEFCLAPPNISKTARATKTMPPYPVTIAYEYHRYHHFGLGFFFHPYEYLIVVTNLLWYVMIKCLLSPISLEIVLASSGPPSWSMNIQVQKGMWSKYCGLPWQHEFSQGWWPQHELQTSPK